jgi:hypothetical protein
MQGMKQPRVTSKVMIVLSQYRITGKIHLHPGQRLSDYINGVKDFIPVTDAKVNKVDKEEEINHMKLLEVNVRHILLVYPLEGKELPSESEVFEESADTENKPDDLENLRTVYVDPFKKKN